MFPEKQNEKVNNSDDEENNMEDEKYLSVDRYHGIKDKYPISEITSKNKVIDIINKVLKDKAFITEQKKDWLRNLKQTDPINLGLEKGHISIFYSLIAVIISELTKDANKDIGLDHSIFEELGKKIDNSSAGLNDVSECMVHEIQDQIKKIKREVKESYSKLNIKDDLYNKKTGKRNKVVSICNTMFCNEILKYVPMTNQVNARTVIRRMCNNLKELEYKDFIEDMVVVIEKVFEDQINKLQTFDTNESEYLKDELVLQEFKKQFSDFLIQYNLILLEHLEKNLKNASGINLPKD